jgi:hypothetical protein
VPRLLIECCLPSSRQNANRASQSPSRSMDTKIRRASRCGRQAIRSQHGTRGVRAGAKPSYSAAAESHATTDVKTHAILRRGAECERRPRLPQLVPTLTFPFL